MNDLSNYMLYNFHDTPLDLFERMYLNVRLNEELGIRIYSFPMRYQPTDLPDRSHVGPKWNRYFLRSVQIVLQATRGVVSGEPDFFRAAFGSTGAEFEDILIRPHHMIFNRRWFEFYEGRAEFDDYLGIMRKLSPSERLELLDFLSSRMPARYKHDLVSLTGSVLKAARFYIPMERERELKIRKLQQGRREHEKSADIRLSPAEIVEDAGLENTDFVPLPKASAARRKSTEISL
jgi:hypothetical protein